MNRTSAVIGAAILILIFIGALFFILQKRDSSQIPVNQPEQTTSNDSVEANGASVVVMYTDAGFSPATVTVSAGTTVTWSNQSSHALWVIDSSKTTDTCPTNKGTLNECQLILSGGSYSFTATTPGTITYTNKENARDKGSITITSVQSINPEALPQ